MLIHHQSLGRLLTPLLVVACIAGLSGRARSADEIERRIEFLDEPIELKAVFPPWWNGKMLFPPQAWTPEEKRAVVRLFHSVEAKLPFLVAAVVEERPLRLYRTCIIEREIPAGYHLADHDIWFGDEWAAQARSADETFRAEATLIHELTHALDSFRQLSWSPEWVRLVKPRLDQINRVFVERTGLPRLEFPPSDPRHLPLLETLAHEQGLPSAYATSSLSEALAECVRAVVADPPFTLPVEIEAFVRSRVLALRTLPASARHAHRALLAFEQERDAEGARELDSALEAAPDLAMAYYLRGRRRRQAEDYEPSLADFSRAIELAPENEREFLMDRADTYALYRPKDETNLEKGLADLDRYLAEHPQDWLCRAQRGVYFLNSGLPHRALPEFNAALAAKPDAAAVKMNRIWSIRSMLGNLQAKDPELRLQSAEGLAAAGPGIAALPRLGDDVLPALKAALHDEDPAVRRAVETTLRTLETFSRSPESK